VITASEPPHVHVGTLPCLEKAFPGSSTRFAGGRHPGEGCHRFAKLVGHAAEYGASVGEPFGV